MDSIMQYVMETYGFIIQEDEKGKKIADGGLIDALDLSPQEKAFVRLTFRTYGAEIIERKKEEITEGNRSDKTKDYNYGDIESHELESFDKPVLARIEYDGRELVFEDYEELDDFIIHEFIPDNVHMKRNKSRNSKALDLVKPYPSINLSDIVKLKLSEKEVEHVVDVLYKQGIRIGGTSQDLDSEFVNYDYIRTYASKRYEKMLTPEEEKAKFMEYQKTHDPLLREELIVRNLRLVPYVAWRLALRHEIDQEELESYGYEGLMYAVEMYDPLLETHFSTYAIPCIEGYIKKNIPKLKEVPQYLYYAFQNVRYIVEKEWGKKFDGDPEMLDEIVDVMADNGSVYYSISARQEMKQRILGWSKLSVEELREEEQEEGEYREEDDLDSKLFVDMMQEKVHDILDTLTPREEKILRLRFGLTDGHEHTLEEVAKEFNVTRERVRQIECKALRKLRHPSRSKKLKGYILGESEDQLRDPIKAAEERNRMLFWTHITQIIRSGYGSGHLKGEIEFMARKLKELNEQCLNDDEFTKAIVRKEEYSKTFDYCENYGSMPIMLLYIPSKDLNEPNVIRINIKNYNKFMATIDIASDGKVVCRDESGNVIPKDNGYNLPEGCLDELKDIFMDIFELAKLYTPRNRKK